MRIDGYEIVGELLDDAHAAPEQTPRWLARDADGSLVELATIRAHEHERAEALARFTRLRALAHPALPKLIALEGDPSVTSELMLVSAHRRRVALVRAAHAHEGEGLAMPLVCTIAHDVARTLAALHAAGVVHGLVSAWSVAIDAEGLTCLDAPRVLRVPATARHDIDALVVMMCSLICATKVSPRDLDPHAFEDDGFANDEHDAFTDATDDEQTAEQTAEHAADHLRAHRKDAPQELVDIIAATRSNGGLDARAFADALARDLPWTQWPPQHVLDELRALLPDDVAKLTA